MSEVGVMGSLLSHPIIVDWVFLRGKTSHNKLVVRVPTIYVRGGNLDNLDYHFGSLEVVIKFVPNRWIEFGGWITSPNPCPERLIIIESSFI